MKRLLVILSASVFMSATCHKASTSNQAYIRGKVSYRSCATIVVQVLDQKYHYLAEDSWKQSEEKPVIENVFAVANQCSFPADYKPGDTFYFELVKEDPSMKDCAVCKLYDNPPKVKQMVKVIVADKE
jgi:hypothetical protein